MKPATHRRLLRLLGGVPASDIPAKGAPANDMPTSDAVAPDAPAADASAPPPPASTWDGYTRDALAIATHIDFDPVMLLERQQHPERVAPVPSDRVCNWYLPTFDSAFYGGIMTILRLADQLHREHGIRQRVLICGQADAVQVKAQLVEAFPSFAAADVLVLDSGEALAAIPPADYSVATLWTTAYVLLGVRNTGLKFYMIQDFEPLFYPGGSTYAQTELTYRFGFYGICNTRSLLEIYERDYEGCGVRLEPSIDPTVFFDDGRARPGAPYRVFYYARPGTPRNAFELAAAALRNLKARFGDGVEIICAGKGWSPADYGLDQVVTSVGMLPYADTGELYRSCHVGFVMMMTKHPSYLPFELMACGATVVTNYNDANTWLLRDGENCLLSPPSGQCLGETLAHALSHYDQLAPLRANAARHVRETLRGWDDSLRQVTRFMLDPPPQFATRTPWGRRFAALQPLLPRITP